MELAWDVEGFRLVLASAMIATAVQTGSRRTTRGVYGRGAVVVAGADLAALRR